MRLPQNAREWFVAAARTKLYNHAFPHPRNTGDRSGRKYLTRALQGPAIASWYREDAIFREGKAPGYLDENVSRHRAKQAEFRRLVASGKKLKQSQIRKQQKGGKPVKKKK